jgi:hypothetical protein
VFGLSYKVLLQKQMLCKPHGCWLAEHVLE